MSHQDHEKSYTEQEARNILDAYFKKDAIDFAKQASKISHNEEVYV